MHAPAEDDITLILAELNTDKHDTAVERLLPLVYGELRALSQAYLSNERVNHTLQATALVHEAYIRLAEGDGRRWESRAHFFRAAAKTMRRILLSHARKHNAAKRGAGASSLQLEETMLVDSKQPFDLLSLDQAMRQLAQVDPLKSQVVELRVFAGCTIDETAEALEISTATVERHWRVAKAWLRSELGG